MMITPILIICFVLIEYVEQRADIPMPRSLDISDINQCTTHNTCSKCLQQPGCAWCSQKEFSHNGESLNRCNTVEWFKEINDHLRAVNCSRFETLGSSTIQKIQDNNLGGHGIGHQLRPQRVLVKTVPHKPIDFEVTFTRVKGYPVDLYYIMDLSTTMKPSKDKLVNLAASIAEAMRNITTDFQLGFGSFIDKPITPFVNELLTHSKPYLFRHHMKLTKDSTDTFAMKVDSSPTFTNLDPPEGGLEALMQAVVCTEQIGWRSNSHRMLIFLTDGPYHVAGDGKLAGIITPNDETCHVFQDRDGYFEYDHYRWLDYPSIAQISRQIANHSINLVFAVPKSVVSTYRDLSTRIPGTYVKELTNDSSNIVALIQDQYNKISSSVRPSHRAPEGISVSYSTSCASDNTFSSSNYCDKIKTGSTVTFNVTISVTKCKSDGNFQEEVEFFAVGVNEVVKIELDVNCLCSCDDNTPSQSGIANDDECNQNGKLSCGNCDCDPGFWGPSCECKTSAEKSNENINGCKPPSQNNATSLDCSGHGYCFCDAKCICQSPPGKKVWGSYCECNDFACPISPINKQVCSGPTQGACPCNGDKCKCESGWTGESCECPENDETCYPSGIKGDAPCSGHGACICGKCECYKNKDGDAYAVGEYCQILPCEEWKDCVECKAFQSGRKSKEECDQCKIQVELFDEIKVRKDGDLICSFPDDSNCNFFFVHNRLELASTIPVQRTKECTAPPNIVAIVAGVSGAILAIGLFLLLIWKIATTIHDRLEYAKFLRDRDLAKWDRGDNPIYKRPTTVFMNPAYSSEN